MSPRRYRQPPTRPTLCAHTSETLARDLRRRQLQQVIDDYEREHGTIGERELNRIRQEWKA